MLKKLTNIVPFFTTRLWPTRTAMSKPPDSPQSPGSCRRVNCPTRSHPRRRRPRLSWRWMALQRRRQQQCVMWVFISFLSTAQALVTVFSYTIIVCLYVVFSQACILYLVQLLDLQPSIIPWQSFHTTYNHLSWSKRKVQWFTQFLMSGTFLINTLPNRRQIHSVKYADCEIHWIRSIKGHASTGMIKKRRVSVS